MQALAVYVGVNRLEQPLRPSRVRGYRAESGIFDELPFLLSRRLQVRRAETLAIAPAIDREVRPVLASAFPEAHDRNSSMPVRSDDDSGLTSTALARTKSSRSAGK